MFRLANKERGGRDQIALLLLGLDLDATILSYSKQSHATARIRRYLMSLAYGTVLLLYERI
jgi:hypothetical protein